MCVRVPPSNPSLSLNPFTNSHQHHRTAAALSFTEALLGEAYVLTVKHICFEIDRVITPIYCPRLVVKGEHAGSKSSTRSSLAACVKRAISDRLSRSLEDTPSQEWHAEGRRRKTAVKKEIV